MIESKTLSGLGRLELIALIRAQERVVESAREWADESEELRQELVDLEIVLSKIEKGAK